MILVMIKILVIMICLMLVICCDAADDVGGTDGDYMI